MRLTVPVGLRQMKFEAALSASVLWLVYYRLSIRTSWVLSLVEQSAVKAESKSSTYLSRILSSPLGQDRPGTGAWLPTV